MFISFRLSDSSTLYVSKDSDGGVRFENYSEARGLVMGKSITAENATELKRFLESQGF